MLKWMSLVAVLTAISLPAVGRAAQYFVSPTGNNSAAGTSNAPWLTLQHAADVVHAGDRVTVCAATMLASI